MRALSADTISQVALSVREQLGARSVLDAVPLAHVRGPLPILGMHGRLTVTARGHGGLDGNVYAVTSIDLAEGSACIWLHREAWPELRREVPRTRFTICHELAHLSVHADELDGLDVEAEPDHDERLESEANRFAAHLLIPDQALRRLVQHGSAVEAKALTSRFGVSEVTAERRIREWMDSH